MTFDLLIQQLSQLEFIWPWLVALLPLPWLIRYLLKPVQQTQQPLLAPQIMARLSSQLPKQPLIDSQTPRQRLSIWALLIWFLLILAATRPVIFWQDTPFKASGKEMILAVDLSGSMQKNDMYLNGDEVNRLVAVKSVVTDFINKRQGDRMGLIVFGTQAFLQSPLTYDLDTVNTLLTETAIGMAGNNTAIGDAIGLTLKHLLASKPNPQTSKDTVLVLLTDGSNTAGSVEPLEAAQKAQEMGLKIYTIGVGKVRSRVGLDKFMTNRADMDVNALTRIATVTGGQFFQANDTEQLEEIYQSINQLESVEHEIYNYRLRTELYAWPLGLALLLSLGLAWVQLQRTGN